MFSYKSRVVLVGTLYPAHIGAVSRVMSNMDVSELILVRPECPLTYEAQLAAARGQRALRKIRSYKSWSDFLSQEDGAFRLAFSGKSHSQRKTFEAKFFFEKSLKNHPGLKDKNPLVIDLVFGSENVGLRDSDIEHVHQIVYLPTGKENPSLNLSHAVLLGLHIMRDSLGEETTSMAPPMGAQSKEFPEEDLRAWIEGLGFRLEDRKHNAFEVFKRTLLGNFPTKKELHIMKSVINQTRRKIRSGK